MKQSGIYNRKSHRKNINASGTTCMLLILFALTVRLAPAQDSVFDPNQAFIQAGEAYDQGETQKAIVLYEDIAAHGYAANELFYNLGNAYFRAGKAGMAILSFERARMLAPRDSDVRANLRFAMESTGAIRPGNNLVQRYLQEFSLPEWIALAVTSYWLTAILACLMLAFFSWRRTGRKFLYAIVALLVLSLLGTSYWLRYRVQSPAVVVEPSQRVLAAPLGDSTPLFSLPEGSIVKVLEESGPWIRVSADKKSGWLPTTACIRVYPFEG